MHSHIQSLQAIIFKNANPDGLLKNEKDLKDETICFFLINIFD